MGNQTLRKARSSPTEAGYSSKALGDENFNIRISDGLMQELKSRSNAKKKAQEPVKEESPAEQPQATESKQVEETKEALAKEIDVAFRNNEIDVSDCNGAEKALSECYISNPGEVAECSVLEEVYRKCLMRTM